MIDIEHDIAIYSPWASVYFSDPPQPGAGAELQTSLLSQGLANRGLRVAHIVYPVKRPRATGSLTLIERRPPRLGRDPLSKAVELFSIIRALRAACARVLVIRGAGAALTAASLVSGSDQAKFVFSASNDLDFGRRDRAQWTQVIQRRSLRRADAVVVQTEQQMDLAKRSGVRARLVRIPSFAEPAQASARDEDGFLWIGRIVDYKRPLEFVDLAERLPEARFRMLATETPETPAELMKRIERAAERLPNFELLPPRPREEVLSMIANSVGIVVTSLNEGMPNVFLEAWARGVPTLTLHFDPDGLLEERGVGLSAGGSKDRFVSMAAELWRDGELRNEIGGRAREYVRTTHDPERVLSQWQSLLAEVAANGQASAALDS